VGICSTTYGDLVCRGCKRFAHEIVSWNGYDAEQKDRVWARLNTLRAQVLFQTIHVADEVTFHAYVEENTLAETGLPEDAGFVYQILARLVARGDALSKAGLERLNIERDIERDETADDAALATMKSIDSEIFNRSNAHYERNFRVTS
jgi:predicted Fe-S protein YdhL (DUF1289 family)